METKISIKKETNNVDHYTIRNNYEWGTIFIHSYKGGGIFSALTSFGNYSYHWGSVGSEFKDFLSDLDYCYFMGKTTKHNGEVFDFDASQKDLIRMVLESRRRGEITPVQAREFYNEVGSLEDCDNRHDWYHQIYSEGFPHGLFELVIVDHEDIPNITRKCPQAKGFWDKIYKPLIEEFKNQKENA